ncbi:hypothetical protein [Mumia sp. DW29H23]|uniref:hypothetical protein n=1 Tax=Mumia sp. DW29H23 TaxID=3421241 RepID=UPI003D6976F4
MRRTLGVVMGLVVAGSMVPMAPAHAAQRTVEDRIGDGVDGMDITSITVKNRRTSLILVVKVTDLKRRGQLGSVGFYLDTRPKRRGPEFAVGGGTSDGTDWGISPVRRWRPGMPIHCRVGMSVDYARDRVAFRVSPTCLGAYGKVRVIAGASDTASGSQRSDWAPKRRTFTRWVHRG